MHVDWKKREIWWLITSVQRSKSWKHFQFFSGSPGCQQIKFLWITYRQLRRILRKSIDELRVPLYKLQSNFTSCKFVLPDGNKIMSWKLFFASWELLFMSYKFKEIFFQVASCVLWIENWKFHFKNFTSWKFKTIMFSSC